MLTRPRVLIADDHTLVAELCQRLLETEFDVIGTLSNGQAMVRVAARKNPDVIIADIGMPVLNGLDAGRKVKRARSTIKLIYLTMHPDPELAAEAFRLGASGYLLKTCASSELIIATREVLQGKFYVSRTLPNDSYLRFQDKVLLAEDLQLTQRQREVLQLLAEGKVMKEVGDILQMTTRTVAFHKYRIMEVLGAKSNAELVRYAVRTHLVAA
jgi:DNA-binding NarL/FixJ family response regulator